MKTAVAALFTAALCGVSAMAAATEPAFKLVLISDDTKYNGTVLDACHNGASFEALCPSNYTKASKAYESFHFNQTSSGSAKYGNPGELIYKFAYTGESGTEYENESVTLVTYLSTNVAMIEVGPVDGNAQQVAFDPEGLLNLQSAYDDTVTPPTDTTTVGYYRWYICETYYEGYTYETLNFVFGKEKPQNPSCVATQVKRVYFK